MIKIKNKKSMGDISLWNIILGAVVAIVIAGLVTYIVKEGLFTQQKNVNLLSSCKNLQGTCKADKCGAEEASYFKIGCPDENGNGKIDAAESTGREYCCISKEKSIIKLPNEKKQ